MSLFKLLFISTSQSRFGPQNTPTGMWLEEFASPYFVFMDAGANISLASPKGGSVPLDPKSQSIIVSNSTTKRFYKDPIAMKQLSRSFLLEDMNAEEFDAVLLTGGHGAMIDLYNSEPLKKLLEAFNQSNKPIGAVSQGVAGLLNLQNPGGDQLVSQRNITACSNSEEVSSGQSSLLPFLIETALTSAGAHYSKGRNFESHVMTDINLVTGQNASSSREVAMRIKALIQEKPISTVHSFSKS